MSKSKSRNLSQAVPSASASRTNSMDQHQLPDKNNNNPPSSKRSKESSRKSKDFESYSLRPRSIQNRIETERRQKGEVKKEPKAKHKPPPLSKYRRKTANARERSRMREINVAYELLQKAVPQYPVLPTNAQGKTCEKLTKITTLRLAMNYIQTLQSLLNQPGGSKSDACAIAAAFSSNEDSNSVSGLDSPVSSPSSKSSSYSCNASINSVSGSDYSPESSFSSYSPVGPDCIQTVMRSVVSPAAAAAISANAKNLNSVSLSSLASSHGSLGIVAPQSITTIVTIPSHPHAQAQYSRQVPPTVHHHLHHHQTLPPPPPPSRQPVQVTSSAFFTPTAMTPSTMVQAQQKQIILHPVTTFQNPVSCSSSSPQQRTSPAIPINNNNLNTHVLTASASHASNSIYLNSNNNKHDINSNKIKLPPIATTLSSALLRKSMSSFLTDCVQLTNNTVNVSMNNNNRVNINEGCNNNGHRTGSLSSLTESDFSEYTNDLLSDEGSVLDDFLDFPDFLGTDNLGFTTTDLC